MRRTILIIAGMIATSAFPGHAFAQRGYYAFGEMRPSPHENDPIAAKSYVPPAALPSARRFTAGEVRQIVGWGEVGKCVVGRAPEASLTYVTASRKSVAALAAAGQVAAAFDACLASSQISKGNNAPLRRAALADALGIKPTR